MKDKTRRRLNRIGTIIVMLSIVYLIAVISGDDYATKFGVSDFPVTELLVGLASMIVGGILIIISKFNSKNFR